MENSEYSERIKKFKLENTQTLLRMMCDNGGANLMISMFLKDLDKKDRFGIAFMPIPGEMLNSSRLKDQIVEVLPHVFKQLIQNDNELLAISFSSEAWVRTKELSDEEKTEFKDTSDPDVSKIEYEHLPKKEALIITYEGEGFCDIDMKYIHREGKMINSENKLVDCIRLEDKMYEKTDPKDSSHRGRFMGLYELYLKTKKEML